MTDQKRQKKWWVGKLIQTNRFQAFKAESTPIESSHGDLYSYCVGPFKTKRGAMWAEKYGNNNPHFVTVNDAERYAKMENTGGTK